MRISTKGRYALRAMLDIASQPGGKPVVVKKVCERQHISNLYLMQIFSQLKKTGLLRSVRGPEGGFILARPASQITVAEVIQVMEGSNAPVDCVDSPDICITSEDCAVRLVWTQVKEAIDKIFTSYTLEDLLKRESKV